MNDAWYESLIGIKNDCEDGIITSWWDFGHWFVAVAERRVTFDGGNQGERIHWVGKSLITKNETTAIGLLRMLNCGQEEAPHILEKYLDDDTVKAIDILNKIIVEDDELLAGYLSTVSQALLKGYKSLPPLEEDKKRFSRRFSPASTKKLICRASKFLLQPPPIWLPLSDKVPKGATALLP